MSVRSSARSKIIVTSNHAPQPFITEPHEGLTYAGGDTLVLTGGATDQENGLLDEAALTWEVRFNHGGHDHGFTGEQFVGTDNVTSHPAPSGETSDDVWYTVYLTAEQSLTEHPRRSSGLSNQGRSASPSIPRRAVASNIDGPPHATPYQVVGVGRGLPRLGRRGAGVGGKPQGFVGWSDGGARQHAFVTPATSATVTASYAPLPFGAGASPECKVAPMDDVAAVTFSGNLGSSLNLLRNGDGSRRSPDSSTTSMATRRGRMPRTLSA